MGSYLDDLLRAAYERVAHDKSRRSQASVEDAAYATQLPPSFRDALTSPGVAVIAEIKRASPSKGPLAPELDAVAQAKAYQAGGAAAISVLTEPHWFKGSLGDLEAVSALGTPTLRKEFIVDAYQVFEARGAGASAVLLIAAALELSQLAELYAAAQSVDLDVLVEVHDESEAEQVLTLGADIIGVNARDLRSFTLDPDGFRRVRTMLPSHVTAVAESGVKTVDDVTRYAHDGADAILVGEQFVVSPRPETEVARFVAAGQRQVTR